jgi:hypothetical protein
LKACLCEKILRFVDNGEAAELYCLEKSLSNDPQTPQKPRVRCDWIPKTQGSFNISRLPLKREF